MSVLLHERQLRIASAGLWTNGASGLVETGFRIDWRDALQGGEIQQCEITVQPARGVDVVHIAQHRRLPEWRMANHQGAKSMDAAGIARLNPGS